MIRHSIARMIKMFNCNTPVLHVVDETLAFFDDVVEKMIAVNKHTDLVSDNIQVKMNQDHHWALLFR